MNVSKRKKLTYERVHELLDYDLKTGLFTWKVFRRYNAMKGDIAGYINKRGYRVIAIDNHPYKASRLAHLWVEGYFPEHEMDHIKRDNSDDSWDKLRVVSRLCNNLNRGVMKNNSSGVTGVYWSKALSKWRAVIKINYKNTHLGYFKSKYDAVEARYLAEKKYNFISCNENSSAKIFLENIGGHNV